MSDASDAGLTEYTVSARDAIAFICDSPTGYAEVSPDGRFRWVNNAYAMVLNAHKEQILGTSWAQWTHPDDTELDKELSEKISSGQLKQYRLVKRYRQLGHTESMPRIVWGELTVFGKFDNVGKFVGYRVTFVPYLHHDAASAGGLEWKKWLRALLGLSIENWKTVLAIVLTLAGSTLINSDGLRQQLQDMQKLKQELEGLSPDSSSPLSPPPPGRSAQSTETSD